MRLWQRENNAVVLKALKEEKGVQKITRDIAQEFYGKTATHLWHALDPDVRKIYRKRAQERATGTGSLQEKAS